MHRGRSAARHGLRRGEAALFPEPAIRLLFPASRIAAAVRRRCAARARRACGGAARLELVGMIEPMPDLEEKAETFANVGAGSPNADVLVIPGWAKPEWRTLFSYATEQALAAGETLIEQQEAGRTLYFVVAGVLQAAVSPHSGVAPSYGGPP